ncbi:MAG: triple tyrosine motif-containing protein [Clostridium sp.]
MRDLVLSFDTEAERVIDEEILLEASAKGASNLEYKFFEGKGGVWTPITDFSNNNTCIWSPKESGKYMMMVQAKEADSKRPFDCSARSSSIEIKDIERIGDIIEEVTIKDIHLEKISYIVGEKINIEVETSRNPSLVRFWRKAESDWELLKDYDLENKFSYTAVTEGREEILVECKSPDSGEPIDDYKTITVNIEKLNVVEITSIQCLDEKLLVGEDLEFKVSTNCDNKRNILYKFVKVDKYGEMRCIQDYSSHNFVSFKNNEAGEYKLLCLVRDMFSTKSYDDRALISYNVIPYEVVKINKFYGDVCSPQLIGTMINLISNAEGGKRLVYRYIIEGPISEDSGYIRNSNYVWEPKKEGDYSIILKVKDISFDGEHEDTSSIKYIIDKKGEKPPKIISIKPSKEKNSVINEPINIKVESEGGNSVKYSFIVFKDGVENERVEYGDSNWVNFIPEEKGEYEIEVRVKDKYSKKDYDSNGFVSFKIKEYVPAKIDYMLKNSKELYLVGDSIEVEAVCADTQNVLVKYVTKINGHEVEDTGFIRSKKFIIKPRCAGKYTVESYAKNINSEEEYDDKNKIVIFVNEATPVHNTTIEVDRDIIYTNEEVTFNVYSKGGKDVCYEFYIMEKGNWVKMQSYSKKAYYTFLPFVEGNYKILVLSKSFYKKINYEDYVTLEFKVVR